MGLDDRLTLRVERNGHGPVVHAAGEIDLATAPELRTCLKGLDGLVVVDLRDVVFLDSAGIGVLIGARNRLAEDRGDLALHNPNDVVSRTLKAVGLQDWIDQQLHT
ncbi:MAG TPA: STAS domain-containing protein [Acidimicrobiia bacterium]|nr:STAS domain-containing protein [Acidimicrobiia bacterium]